MFETLLKLYVMYMANDVRSPMPHMFGPPGCGKSSVAQQLATTVGKKLHIINVSRLSPLEIEGIQMPVEGNTRLELLLSTLWNDLQEGDIVLFDEFLRGFPEVYNGLLDIFTSREVAGHPLPQVFIIGASNSTVAYDKALEDRLLHLTVADPRKHKAEKKRLAGLIVDQLGLLPEMTRSAEMTELLDIEVLPMFEVLDTIGKVGGAPTMIKGRSVRHLVGQAQLRHVQSPELHALITMNNNKAIAAGKPQFVLLLDGKVAQSWPSFEDSARKLVGNDRLTEVQARNLQLNLQLIEMEQIRVEKEPTNVADDDDIFTP